MERPGIMIYINFWERLMKRLSYEQLGRLLKATLDMASGQTPESLEDDPAVAMAYEMVGDQLERDAIRYNEIVEKRRAAGRKSASKRRLNAEHRADDANTGEQMPASVNTGEQNEPNTISNPNLNSNPNTNSNPSNNSLSQPHEGSSDEPYEDVMQEREQPSALCAEEKDAEREEDSAFQEAEEEREAVPACPVGEEEPVLCNDPFPQYDAYEDVPPPTDSDVPFADLSDCETEYDMDELGTLFEEPPREAMPQAHEDVPAGDARRKTKAAHSSVPDVNDILTYARAAHLSVDRTLAERFIALQAAHDWRDSNDKPIRDWRRWFTGWLDRQPPKGTRDRTPTALQYDMRSYSREELDRLTAFMEDEE